MAIFHHDVVFQYVKKLYLFRIKDETSLSNSSNRSAAPKKNIFFYKFVQFTYTSNTYIPRMQIIATFTCYF